MEPSTIPMAIIETGVTQEERSFEWRIRNFPVVLKHESMIDSQHFDFYAGESIGMGSKWRLYLQAEEEDGTTSVGLYFRSREQPKPVFPSQNLCVQIIFTLKNKAGAVKKTFDSKVIDFYDKEKVESLEHGLGCIIIRDVKRALPSYMELIDGSLVLHITFRLFALSKAIHPLKGKLEEFEVKSTAKAREDLAAMLMENRVTGKDIKIFANDKKEFKMQKDILSARSPVFRAMLEADMTEGTSGVVEIQDMGSESLKVMLHFMSRGELLPEWMLSEVLVELTNAAAKYELTDLLNFLDGVLGDVCTLHNVGMLIALANRLSLKTAEAELLSFLKRKGASSSDNFLQVSHGILASAESRAEEASGLSGASSDQIEGDDRPPSTSGCSCACCRRRNGKRIAVEKEEDNEAGKSKTEPPKKVRRGRSQK